MQQYMDIAQQFATQATELTTQFVDNAATTLESMNIPQYVAPLLPVYDQVVTALAPLPMQALQAALPHLQPLRDAAEPYLGEGKQYLDKVTQEEFVLLIVGIFGGTLLLQTLFALTATCRRRASPLKAFSPTVFWLLFCVVIHSWIEYAYVFRRTGNASGFENGLNLYGAADYRYGFGERLELEEGTGAMEAITALIVGPLCLLLAWAIVGNKSWRWGLQVLVCTCQMYGLTWFVFHAHWSSVQVASNDPFLFYVFFVGFNAPWGIVPTILLFQALGKINKAIQQSEKTQKQVKGL